MVIVISDSAHLYQSILYVFSDGRSLQETHAKTSVSTTRLGSCENVEQLVGLGGL